jgi:peptidylprolyl isomerase
MTARIGDAVKVHFICKLLDGTLYETSFGDDPLEFTIGDGRVIQALEEALIGMEPGESGRIAISADRAYGPYRRELLLVMGHEQITSDDGIQVGMQVHMAREGGGTDVATIIDISDSGITLDANHPLAGKDLIFDILLMDIGPFSSRNAVVDNFTNAVRDKGNLNDIINTFSKTPQVSILISVPVFNRRKITQLSLAQTKRYKTPYCYLQVYNDHSTEFDNSFLAHYADEVVQLPVKMGIHNLRRYQFRKFLEADFDFIYMTDNDVIHDPQYVTVLQVLYELGNRKLPVCLYNTEFHNHPSHILCRSNGTMIKKKAHGVSMFYDRKMVEKIVSMMDRVGNAHDAISWDLRAVSYLDLPWITPDASYLEHYGANGINNNDYERDKAMNPTIYLRDRRESILKYLTQHMDSQIDF